MVKVVTGPRGATGKAGPKWLESDIARIETKMDKLVGAIYEGNGQRSLMERTARVEENIEVLVARGQVNADHIGKIADAIEGLTISVKLHHAETHLSQLIKSPKFWTVFIGGFVVIHELATYAPNLWNTLAIVTGHPELQIQLQ